MNQLEADVVVIAGGASGLSAAVTAAEGGAKVIILEKASTTGGTGNLGTGLLAVESRLQRQKMIGLTKEEAFKIFMDYTHWRVDARLVKAYIDKSASTIDWLESLGVEFAEPAAFFPGSNFTWHLIKGGNGFPGPQSAANMMRILTNRANEMGVKILLQTPAKKILKEKGRIVGVMAEDRPEEAIQVNSKAVIIATGGFGDNPEWIKKYTGYEWGRDLFSYRISGLVGDGIRMAWEVGAAEDRMNIEITYGLPGPGPWSIVGQPSFRQPNLMVNLLGERFINEELMLNPTFTGNAISRQKNRCAFVILDGAAKKHYEEVGFDILTLGSPMNEGNLDADIAQALDQGNENIFVADSIEELAGKIGVNTNALQKTVDEYNKFCETGRDELFNKNAKYLRPVKQPKFYAGRYFPAGYGTLGGIKINHKTEVLTKDHEVIPGLYAVGTDACGIYGDSYVFVLPGNTMGFAVNSGRIAGENALEYIANEKKGGGS
jgi:fumarate reductase flavoprotein subunit